MRYPYFLAPGKPRSASVPLIEVIYKNHSKTTTPVLASKTHLISRDMDFQETYLLKHPRAADTMRFLSMYTADIIEPE